MEYEKIIELINDFGNSKLNNLKLDFPDGTKIDMSKNEEKVKIVENIEMPNSQKTLDDGKDYVQTKETINENKSKKGKIMTSPMVGTFYLKPSPNAEPYVKVGQNVKKGDVLCIIEAMKLMNEIESEYSGTVTEICVKDGQPVEYGQVLMYVE